MKKIVISAIALAFISSCGFNKVSLGNYNLPTNNIKTPTKVGKSCTTSSLFFFENDLTVESARVKGDIKDIVAIELEDTFYPFYFKRCTIVKGN